MAFVGDCCRRRGRAHLPRDRRRLFPELSSPGARRLSSRRTAASLPARRTPSHAAGYRWRRQDLTGGVESRMKKGSSVAGRASHPPALRRLHHLQPADMASRPSPRASRHDDSRRHQEPARYRTFTCSAVILFAVSCRAEGDVMMDLCGVSWDSGTDHDTVRPV